MKEKRKKIISSKQLNSMMQGAFILTLSSFIAKILSAFYRVPYQNLVGDEGFYVYQQVYPIYGIGMTLAMSGLPIFLSKIIAEQKTEEEKQRVIQNLFPLIITISVGLFLLIFFSSNLFALGMGDRNLAPLIRVIAFIFLITPYLSVYRGYFQGLLWMTPTAISQVLEQLLRVGIILCAAFLGSQLSWSIYKIAEAALVGALVGCAGSGGLLFYYNRHWEHSLQVRFTFSIQEVKTSFKKFGFRFFLESGLICLYSSMLIIYQFADSFLVKNMLVYNGMSQLEAKIQKGIYDRGQPFVQLGLVVAIAFSSSFVPALSAYFSQNNTEKFLLTAKQYIRMTIFISFAATAGIILLLPLMNFALFKDGKGQIPISLFVGSVALMSLVQAYQMVFQSSNQMKVLVKAAVYGIVGKVVGTLFFMFTLGISGASLGTLLGLLLCLWRLSREVNSKLKHEVGESHFYIKLFTCLCLLSLVLFAYQKCIHIAFFDQLSRFPTLLLAILGVFLGVTVYVFGAFKIHLFSEEEWRAFPFFGKIVNKKRKNEEN